MIQATVVADSLSPQGHRLTSLLCTFPKYLLAEFNTHRMFSRNSASSRAIPTHRLLEQVKNNPFIPIAWQKEHKGMQGREYWTDEEFGEESKMKVSEALTKLWLKDRDEAYINATLMTELGATKQMANRLLEPFLWTTVLVSATEWDNFFELRCPEYEYNHRHHIKTFRSKFDYITYNDHVGNTEGGDNNSTQPKYDDVLGWLRINKGQAEIHIMALAEAIWDAMNESKPRRLQAGEWHIPFNDKIYPMALDYFTTDDLYESELEGTADNVYSTAWKVKIAIAMAARTSYTVVGDEKEISYERLIAIHDRLIDAKPLHASPMEHCARAMSDDEHKAYTKTFPVDEETNDIRKVQLGWCRNFRGFIQYRHIIEKEEYNEQQRREEQ